MADNERIDDERAETEESQEVEAHGAKQVAGIGLAAAALIGAGAVGVKVATDDDKSRNQAALVEEDAASRLAKADADRDGYATYRELDAVGLKYDTELLKIEGIDVSAEALSAAGHKVEIDVVDKENGFPLDGDAIMLKRGVSEELDRLVETSAAEWTLKFNELDRDTDGYAGGEELAAGAYKLVIKGEDELDEASWKHLEPKSLEEAGQKIRLADLGAGGFAVEKDTIFLKLGVDEKLDAFIKGEAEG
jgi:hypothetical protein